MGLPFWHKETEYTVIKNCIFDIVFPQNFTCIFIIITGTIACKSKKVVLNCYQNAEGMYA